MRATDIKGPIHQLTQQSEGVSLGGEAASAQEIEPSAELSARLYR
jgi:hypothetical protein